VAWVGVDDALYIHAQIVVPSQGVRDPSQLTASIRSVEQGYWSTLFEMAVAYAHHVAETQCFVDGNKRTALAIMQTFLLWNGRKLTGQEPLAEFMMKISAHEPLANRVADLVSWLGEDEAVDQE